MSILRKRSLLAAASVAVVQIVHWLPTASAQDRELGAGGELLEGVAAVVDEGIVLKSELSERIGLVLRTCSKQQAELPPEQRRPLPPVSIIEQQVLDQLIVREIQLQRADRVGITVSDDLLNEALSRVASNLGYTLEELPAVLAAQNVDYTAYREDSRKDLLIEQLEQRDVIARIAITPRELEQCLVDVGRERVRRVRLQHLAYLDQRGGQQRRNKTSRRRAPASTRFTTGSRPAKTSRSSRSPCRHAQTALDGGSLGWRKGSQLPTLFADRRDPHEARRVLGAPPKRAAGFQIVRLNEMRGAERMMVDQLHARHILLRPNEILDEAAVQQKVLGIREQIVGGDDFADGRAKPCRKTRRRPRKAATWAGCRRRHVPEFEEAMATLQLNELSEPVKTRFGWHLVEVLGAAVARHDGRGEARRNARARSARARPRKSASCGCGGSATRRSSTSAAEAAPRASARGRSTARVARP